MEKIRVPKGEKYWFINCFGEAVSTTECGLTDDYYRFNIGNYFHAKKEAEVIAYKLSVVLKGADVIKMLNEWVGEINRQSHEMEEDLMKLSI